MPFFTTFSSCVQYLTTELHKSAPTSLKDAEAFQKSQTILAALSNPQNATPTIHIAATSGKGSMAHAIEAILRAHAFKTTLMVSPHAYDIRERIQLNGKPIGKKEFVAVANEFLKSIYAHNRTPTYFEALMSMGFMAAAKQQGNYVVTETGLGGLWDTSNTITRSDKIAVIGSIGLDHTHILGNTVEKIAAQKAGILPCGGQALVLRQTDTINAVFETIAKERTTLLHWIEPANTEYETNWKMAKVATQLISQRDTWAYDETLAATAISTLRIPARFEIRNISNQTVILDAAHNPQKAAALTTWLQYTFPKQTFITLLAISDGKDAADIIKMLNPVTQQYVVTSFLTNQQGLPVHAIPTDTLASVVMQQCGTIPVTIYNDAAKALRYVTSQDAPALITGSFYLVGELGNILPT